MTIAHEPESNIGCSGCRFEDKFKNAGELGIDNPYLCTRNAKNKRGLAGCITVTNKERCEKAQNGCEFREEME